MPLLLLSPPSLPRSPYQVMLHSSAPFQAGELQAQQEELSKKLEAKKAEEGR